MELKEILKLSVEVIKIPKSFRDLMVETGDIEDWEKYLTGPIELLSENIDINLSENCDLDIILQVEEHYWIKAILQYKKQWKREYCNCCGSETGFIINWKDSVKIKITNIRKV